MGIEIKHYILQIATFTYPSGRDKTPRILILHSFKHENTGTNLISGINLNYLDEDDKKDLWKILPEMYTKLDPRERESVGRYKETALFKESYRYYNISLIKELDITEWDLADLIETNDNIL